MCIRDRGRRQSRTLSGRARTIMKMPIKVAGMAMDNISWGFTSNPMDYLEYMAALKGLPRTEAARQIDALLERVSLTVSPTKPSRPFTTPTALSIKAD